MSIAVRQVTKRFDNGFVAVDNVSLAIAGGSLTALLGPSGSGKSTLLRIIAGLEQPDAGDVSILGEDVTGVPPQKREVGFVFQHYAAFKHMTVRDNVGFGLKIRKRPKAEIKARSTSCSASSSSTASPTATRPSSPGGQRQRMALARALAVEPKVLLLDEPFGALDARVRKELRAWLRRLHDEVHVTTVLVTHDQEEAMDVADRVTVMNEGRVEQSGKPRDLYEHPANEFVMSFVGPVNRLGEEWIRPHDLELRLEPNGTTSEAMVAAHRPPRLRGPRRADPRRRPPRLRPGDAGRGRGARAPRGSDHLRAAEPDDGVQWDSHASGRAVISAISGGSSPEATSASVSSSSTARMFARSATQTSWSLAAGPAYSTVSGPRAAHVGERALDGADHVRELDLLGRSREPVAAVRPALALDEPAVAQLEQDVLQELEGDVLRLRDPLALRRPLAGGRELERSPQGIVHLRGDPHRRILTAAQAGRTIVRPSTREVAVPELRAEVENGPWPSEPEEVCDLVMKGGVASGVVYPGAILALAKRYRFRNVGGTSAGAIAATVTAASELGRREGGAGGFERLRELADAICEPGRVLGLFQPRPENRSVFELALRMMDARAQGAGARRRVVLDSLRALWLPVVLLALLWIAAVSVAGYALFLWLGWWSALAWPVLAISAAVGVGFLASCAVILFVARPGKALAQTLGDRDTGFGLCPGHDAARVRRPGALGLAPRAHPGLRRPGVDDDPLTFADLKDADDDARSIALQLMTTDVSSGRPVRLPLPDDNAFWFDADEIGKLVPAAVAKWMCDQADEDRWRSAAGRSTRCRAPGCPCSWPRG